MTWSAFRLDVEDRIAHIRLNRPAKANAMTADFWRELPEAVADISDNARARVMVISSEGEHFSAGMDLSAFAQLGAGQDEDRALAAENFFHLVASLQRAFSALENARQPVLAAIQGGAIGAGVDLIAACDCRYASADAFFSVQETAIGMTADVGTFPRLARIVPEGWARQIAYTAERLPAAKAREIGLVNEVYATPEAMLAAVMEIAGRIAAHSPLAVSGCKRMLNYARDHSTADALEHVALWNAAMLRAGDLQESFAARAEKRAPAYPDLKPVRRTL